MVARSLGPGKPSRCGGRGTSIPSLAKTSRRISADPLQGSRLPRRGHLAASSASRRVEIGLKTTARYQPRHGALGDVESELEQFAVNAWGIPERIGRGDLVHELSESCVETTTKADAQSGHACRSATRNSQSAKRITGFGRVGRYMESC